MSKTTLGDVGDWAAMAAMAYGKCSGEIAWAISTQLRKDVDLPALLLSRLREARRVAEGGAENLSRAIVTLEGMQ